MRPWLEKGLQAFYSEDNICFLRSTKTGEDSRPDSVVERALSQEEMERRERLESFMDGANEDAITEQVVVPILQDTTVPSHLGHRTQRQGHGIW